MTYPRSTPMPSQTGEGTSSVKLIIAWVWVGIPLAWGIWNVFLTSLKLFR